MQRDRHDTDFTAFYECLVYQFPSPLDYCVAIHMTQKAIDLFMWVLFSYKAAVKLVTNSKPIVTVIPAHYWLAFTCSL